MRKKIISFILLFISLFIFENVNAANTYCGYRDSSETLYLAFKVDENGNLIDIEGKSDAIFVNTSRSVEVDYNERELIDNWTKELKGTTMTGKDYFIKYKKCPENVIISNGSELVLGKWMYVSVVDLNDMLDKVKAEKKQADGYPKTLSLFVSKEIESGNTICNYKSHTQGISAKFEIVNGDISGKPSISGDNSQKDVIFNWYGVLKDTNFMGIDYFILENKCPSYFYVVRRGLNAYRFYVSNEGEGSDFENKLKQQYSGMKDLYILPLLGSKEEQEDEEEWEDNLPSSCTAFTNPTDCNNGYTDNDEDGNPDSDTRFSCIWNETKYGNYCNTDNLLYVTCGDAFDIPHQAPVIISFIVNFLKILTPILLIVLSIISLFKALSSSSEDEIKKAQKSLIKKVIAAVMVFFVVSIVQFVVMKFADSTETDNLSSCLSCFLNGDCGNTTYYKTNVHGAGTYLCKKLEGDKSTYTCPGNK